MGDWVWVAWCLTAYSVRGSALSPKQMGDPREYDPLVAGQGANPPREGEVASRNEMETSREQALPADK